MKSEWLHRLVVLGMVLLAPFTLHHSPFTINPSPLSAQTSMLSIGVRGGGQMCLPAAAVGATGEVHPSLGGIGSLDLRYNFYGYLTDRFALGFAVGAGVGYGSSGIKGSNTDSYSNTDYLGNTMDYTVTSSFTQTNRFAQADISLLPAMRFGGLTLHVGPRLSLPFAPTTTFAIHEASIDAYYPRYDVHVVDQLITGKLETPVAQDLPSNLPKYTIQMALELGYEWYLSENNCLGIQAFADVAVWSPTNTLSPTTNPLIQVAPITNAANPVPAVTVNASAAGTLTGRYLDFGIRAYYAFSFSSSRRARRSPARDTRLHHNRILIN